MNHFRHDVLPYKRRIGFMLPWTQTSVKILELVLTLFHGGSGTEKEQTTAMQVARASC